MLNPFSPTFRRRQKRITIAKNTFENSVKQKKYRNPFKVDDIFARDKTSLDIFWIKDKSLADLDNLPDPDVLASDIIDNLQSAIDSFNAMMGTLNK